MHRPYLHTSIRWGPIFLLILLSFRSAAQDQPLADSLKQVLERSSFTGEDRLNMLKEIAHHETSIEEALKYANILMSEALLSKDEKFIAAGYLAIGAVYTQSGNIELALENLMQGANIVAQWEDPLKLAQFYGQIAIVYSMNDDRKNALFFQKKAMVVFSSMKDSSNLGIVALNIAFDYYELEEYDSARKYNAFAIDLFEKIGFNTGIGYATGNKALVNWKTNNVKEGEAGLLAAIEILTPLGDDYAIADYLSNLAQLYFENNRIKEAQLNAEKALSISTKEQHIETARDALLLLSTIYEQSGEMELALESHKRYVGLKDSIQSLDITQKMADLRTEFEVAKKQSEINQLASQKQNRDYTLIFLGAVILILAVGTVLIYQSFQTQKRLKAELEHLNQSKDKLFSILSHDLKGPISAFAVVSKLIKSAVLSQNTEVLNDIAEEIKITSNQLSNMLENLLLWTIDERGDFRLRPEVIATKVVVDELEDTYKTMAQSKSIELSLSITDADRIFADKNAVLTILRNLLSNALKFTAPGGKVTLDVSRQGQLVIFKVKDTGIGMSKEQVASIFNFVGNKTSFGTSGEKGLGLGLNLAYKMTNANNGEIAVYSEPQIGSTFTVSLPTS